MKKVYALKGQSKGSKKKLFHYVGCGLDNIYLVNGYYVHKTPHGDGYSIEDAQKLHQVIAVTLVLQKDVLNGAELSFLRKMLDLTQEEFAAKIGITRENYADWERARTKQLITKPSDRLVRFIFLAEFWKASAIKSLQKNLSSIQKNMEDDRLVFDRRGHEWMPPNIAA